MSMRRKAVLLGLAAIVAAAGCGAFLFLRAKPVVKPALPIRAQVPAETAYPAVVRARHIVDVAAPVAGTLEEILVHTGEPVYEGQLLARIKNTALASAQEAAVREAAAAEERLNRYEGELAALRLEESRTRADFSRTQTEFDRIDRLYQRERFLLGEGATPRLKFEKVEKEYLERRADRDAAEQAFRAAGERVAAIQQRVDAARAERDARNQELEAAREHAAAGDVRSPTDGVLVGVSRAAGEEIAAGTPDLLRIAVDLSALEAVLEPPPPVLARIRPGSDALVMFAETGDALAGSVREIKGTEVAVEFSSPNPAIKPGMNAQVRLRLEPVPALRSGDR